MRKLLITCLVALAFAAWVTFRFSEAASYSEFGSYIKNDIYNFQTLITGALALVAAWIAARPVYRQLKASNVQNEIMSREIFSSRIARLESRSAKLSKEIFQFFQNHRNPYIDHEMTTMNLNSHAAFDAEHALNNIIAELDDQQDRREDGEAVQAARTSFIMSAKALAKCLDDIHSPASRGGDPEISAEIEARMDERAALAEQELVGLMHDLDSEVDKIGQAYEKEIDITRDRIRRIDAALLREHY